MMTTIDDIVDIKLERWKLLTRIDDSLKQYELYIHQGLTLEEHKRYVRIGIFELGQDIKNYSDKYIDYSENDG